MENGDTLLVKPEDFPVNTLQYKRASPGNGSPQGTTLPVGSQPLLNDTFHSNVVMPKRQMGRSVKPISVWDFDVSLVRDPRYPEANPRFRLNGNTLLRGDFRKLSRPLGSGGLPDVVHAMVIRDGGNVQADPIDDSTVEPEAPILLPTPDAVFTIDKSGQLTSSTRKEGKWSKMSPIPGGPGPGHQLFDGYGPSQQSQQGTRKRRCTT